MVIMPKKGTVTISFTEDNLIIKSLKKDKVQVLERFEKLTDNFRRAILGMIEVCIEYQEKYY